MLSYAKYGFGLALMSSVSMPAFAAADAPQPAAEAPTQEIIVTAQKRSEKLENVPIAISSVSGDVLMKGGISSTAQLTQVIPSLRLDFSGPFAQPTIRGVGSTAPGNGLSANVATYVDGFYQPSMLSNDFQLLSVTNVSVLKGPQGTLFGRNATGGAILVTTRDPSFTPTAEVAVSYARFNHIAANAYVSAPLTDKIAFDIAGMYEYGDGYVTNVYTGNPDEGRFRKYVIRTKLLVDVDPDTKLVLSYQHSNASDPNQQLGSLYDGIGIADFVPGAIITTNPREVSEDLTPIFKLNLNAWTAKLSHDFGWGSLTSYTQYRVQGTFIQGDEDKTNIPIFGYAFNYKEHSFSQELNLSSKDSARFTWVLGAYYFNDKDREPIFDATYLGSAFYPVYSDYQNTSAIAGFADGTYEVVDHLFLTAGLRYSSEARSAGFVSYAADGTTTDIQNNSKTFNSLTPRAVIRYQLSPRTNVYASYSMGFKSGAFNASGQDVSNPVNPEKIDAYEVGFKTASGLFRFNTSAFYYDYRGLQLSAILGAGTLLTNAASAHIYGADGDFTVTPLKGLDLRASLAYTHARFSSFPNAPYYTQCTDPVACGAGLGALEVSQINAQGLTLPRAPAFTASLGAQYRFALGDSHVTLNADYFHTSKTYFDPVQQFDQPGYGLLNLRATFALPGDHVSLAVFGTNVTNSVYRMQVLPQAPFQVTQTFGEPASYGGSISYKF
jgi:iron complex outermembrane recepter protein